MDCSTVVAFAQQLKTLLISHDQAVTQANLLECRLQQLDQHLFTANINGYQGNSQYLHTKKSILLGLHKVYNQYREQKQNQIKELSTLILKTADSAPTTATSDSDLERSPRGRQPDQDTTVQHLTEDFCMYSRDC